MLADVLRDAVGGAGDVGFLERGPPALHFAALSPLRRWGARVGQQWPVVEAVLRRILATGAEARRMKAMRSHRYIPHAGMADS